MAVQGFLAGVPMSKFDENRPNEMLVAVTEKRTAEEMYQYVETLAEVLR
jgi:hypothetical protein